jgi:hypothetical protein
VSKKKKKKKNEGCPKKKKKKKFSTRNLEIRQELEEKKYNNNFPLIAGSGKIFPQVRLRSREIF